jgi:DNA polymerase-3 subunit delta'
VLLEKNVVGNDADAEQLAALARGSLERAIRMADEQLAEFRPHWILKLAFDRVNVPQEAKHLNAFVEEAGKDAPVRRRRLRAVIEMSIEFYRELTLALSGNEIQGDTVLQCAVAQTLPQWPGSDETAVTCVDRCLEAISQVDANANLATLVECWLDDLSQTARA